MKKQTIQKFFLASVLSVVTLCAFVLGACSYQDGGVEIWTSWETTVEPTCTLVGVETRYGLPEHKTKQTRPIPAIGHDWGDWVVVQEPTLESEGLRQMVCNNDPTHIIEESIPKLEAPDKPLYVSDSTFSGKYLSKSDADNNPNNILQTAPNTEGLPYDNGATTQTAGEYYVLRVEDEFVVTVTVSDGDTQFDTITVAVSQQGRMALVDKDE